jgi:hypothetical protein
MSGWLLPRARLGVTASFIVLITWAMMLTSYLSGDDAGAP